MDFLPHPFSHTFEESWTSTQDNILEKVFSYINITFLDGIIAVFMDTLEWVILTSSFLWCEKDFGGSESLIADQDFSSIWKFVVLFTGMWLFSFVLSGFIVVHNIAHFFLDIFYDFDFSIGCEAIAPLVENLLQVSGDISTCQVDSLDCMWDSITFIDWYCVGNTISGVQDNTGGSTIWIERQYCLDTHIEAWDIENLKHYLGHLFSILLRVQWSLSH